MTCLLPCNSLHPPPPSPARSLSITAFLETTLSFAIGSQQADTCLGDGSAVNWLGTVFQHPCLPDSSEPRQSREAATNILVSTQEECRGRREGVLSNGWKLQAGRLGLNVKTRLRTSEMRRLGFQAVFGLGTHHLFPFDH